MSKKFSVMGVVALIIFIISSYSSVAVSRAIEIGPLAATPTVSPTPKVSNKLAKLANCLDYNPAFGSDRLGPDIPQDAYDTGASKCSKAKPPRNDAELAMFQRAYDIFSWQSFLAINWPFDQGKPLASLTTPGDPQWTTWKESYEVFLPDGSTPAPWNAPRTLPPAPQCCSFPTAPDLTDKSIRILFETRQVNSGLPLWDQNGNKIYYEVLLNEPEFNFIVENEVYNIDGQIAYVNEYTRAINLPVGVYGKSVNGESVVGAIELKLAWKILAGNDIPSRFFTMDAYVLDKDKKQWLKTKVGLVAMHIAHKTFSAQNWVWSTFEQIDNVEVNAMEVLDYAEKGQTLSASFNNPHCPICPVNVEPTPDTTGDRKTQVTRVIPIPEATAELNQQVQALLKAQGSVWQYYQLVGTQFPTNQNAPPASANQGLPDRLTNKSGGYPYPVYLVNAVVETYDQEGNQEASDLVQGPLNDAKQMVFGTQSCMGCHSMAGVAGSKTKDNNNNYQPFYLEGTADFSWLMQTRAQWKK